MTEKTKKKDVVALDHTMPEANLEQVLTKAERRMIQNRYISDYVGDAYKGWENGRVVFEAGTGTGKPQLFHLPSTEACNQEKHSGRRTELPGRGIR